MPQSQDESGLLDPILDSTNRDGVTYEYKSEQLKYTKKNKCQKIQHFSYLFILLTFIFACVILLWSIVIICLPVEIRRKTSRILSIEEDKLLSEVPTKFVVPTAFSYTSYNVDNKDSGDDWAYIISHAFTAYYTRQGVAAELLRSNERTLFSIQSILKAAKEYCKNKEICKPHNDAKNASVDWIYVISSAFYGKLAPEMRQCMPRASYNDKICDEALKIYYDNNYIDFTVKSMRPLSSVSDIKQALKDTEIEVEATMDVYYDEKYVPCLNWYGDSLVCDELEKTGKLFPCPDQIGTIIQMCVRLLATDPVVTFSSGSKRDKVVSSDAKSFSIVGYNDEKREFIVAAPFGAGLSHSIDWLLGKITRENEQYNCPNAEDPSSWVTLDCYASGSKACEMRLLSVLRYNPTPIEKLYALMSTKETLEIISRTLQNKGLSEDRAYVLVRTIPGPDNTIQYLIAEYESKTAARKDPLTSYIRLITLPPMPRALIALFFMPQYNFAINNTNDCGFFALPYDAFEKAHENGVAWASIYDIYFDENSYVRQKNDKLSILPRRAQHKLGYEDIFNATLTLDKKEWASNAPWIAKDILLPKI